MVSGGKNINFVIPAWGHPRKYLFARGWRGQFFLGKIVNDKEVNKAMNGGIIFANTNTN